MLAAQFGHTETVNVLIDAGADVNIRSDDFFSYWGRKFTLVW